MQRSLTWNPSDLSAIPAASRGWLHAAWIAVPMVVGLLADRRFHWVTHEPMFWFAVLGAIVLLFAAAGRPEHRTYLIATAIWLPVALMLSKGVLQGVGALTPTTIDSTLDLHFERQIWLWSSAHGAVNVPFNVVYSALPLAIALGIGFSPRPKSAVTALLQAAAVASLVYIVFPAEGPRAYALNPQGGAHNCMPSLHVTWAALAAAFSTRSLRRPLWIFVSLTAISTLTTGEHYVVDLIAAIPLIALCVWAQDDRAPATCGAGVSA